MLISPGWMVLWRTHGGWLLHPVCAHRSARTTLSSRPRGPTERRYPAAGPAGSPMT